MVHATSPESWDRCLPYLYGVDLYNFAYWWEAHEMFEALWHRAGPKTANGLFFQGLIQVAAAHLKRFMGSSAASQKLVGRGLAKLFHLPPHYMGVAIPPFVNAVERYFDGSTGQPPLIDLHRPHVEEFPPRISHEGF